jgi:hypothetical protein
MKMERLKKHEENVRGEKNGDIIHVGFPFLSMIFIEVLPEISILLIVIMVSLSSENYRMSHGSKLIRKKL